TGEGICSGPAIRRTAWSFRVNDESRRTAPKPVQPGGWQSTAARDETATDLSHLRIGFSMTASILKARNLSKVVPTAEGELTILHDLDLEIIAGDSLAIVGSSGSGKSTLLGLLAGLDLPSGGEVWLAGQ